MKICNIDIFFVFVYSKNNFAENEPQVVFELSLIFGQIWGSLSSWNFPYKKVSMQTVQCIALYLPQTVMKTQLASAY